jgi:hypothetical protein
MTWHGMGLFWFAARILGLLLLMVAGLKLYGLAVDPVAQVGVLSAPWFQALVVQFEIALGAWLLSGKQPIGSWLASFFTFITFAVFSLTAAWRGQTSCGCFGPVAVNPWYAFALDVFVLTVLVFARPDLRALWRIPRSTHVRWVRRVLYSGAGVVAVLLLAFGLAHMFFGSLSAALAYGRGELISAEPRVVDVGQGRPGEARRGKVRLVNHAPKAVRVVGGTYDCSCAVLGDLPVRLAPGEACLVTVEINLPQSPGVFTRTASVMFDDGELKTYRFRVTGQTVIAPK